MLNILTIDVEEWYHAEYVRKNADLNPTDSSSQNLQTTIELLKKHETLATFFLVGEIAKKQPDVVRQIEENGHEVAFHGYYHEPLSSKTPETLQQEIDEFQNATGKRCGGFRAPSFSLNDGTKWALDVLEKNKFKYDSSIFPAITPLYGVGNAPTKPYKPSHDNISAEDDNAQLWEFPLHVMSHGFFRVPMAGGFYLRLFPLSLIVRSIKQANKADHPAVMFIHTWELSSETPRLQLGYYRSFVTYHNLSQVAAKLDRMLSKVQFTSIEDYMMKKGLS